MFATSVEDNRNMLFYELEPFEKLDKFTIEMLKHNPMPEVIKIGIKDNKLLLPISSLIPLEEYLRTGMERNPERFIDEYKVIEERIEKYMIPKDELILNYFYSFVDEGGNLVLPVVPTNFSRFESHTLFEFRASINQTLSEHKVIELKENKKKEPKKKREKNRNKLFDRFISAIENGGGDDLFDFPTDGALPEGIHVIKVRSTGDEYPLMFGPDVVGRDENKCSIAFPGNLNMEAEHCSITLSRGKYFLADLNSRAGTLLNGEKIEPGKTYELCSADLITVASEDLIFLKRN
ncbi:MAG: FHA domain-containing protein [Clostridia bacterium]|nr:FHA domain-containing protein [Clostridia bacterium]